MSLRVFSSGGGTQSTAALVLTAQGLIDFPVHLFANVGDDSEDPETLEYVDKHLKPFAAKHGVEFIELRRIMRDGTERTLLEQLTRNGSRSIPIPVRVANGAPGTRQCTFDFKFRVIDRWLREHGATEENKPVVGIGFTTDEIQRVGSNTGKSSRTPQTKAYPLIDIGLSRSHCYELVRQAGLPKPPKSACWFCPYHRPARWSEMRRDRPDLFKQAVELEALLNRRRDLLGKDHVYLTRFARPLDEAIGEAQTPLFEDDGPAGEFESCDEGVCFT